MSKVRDEAKRILMEDFGLNVLDAGLVLDLPDNWRVSRWKEEARIAKEQALRNLSNKESRR